MSEVFRSVKQYALKKSNILFVDPVYGNNTTAKRERDDLPFQTVPAALAVALPGDTVYLRCGTYTVTSAGENWFKNGVAVVSEEKLTININVSALSEGALFNAATAGDVMEVYLPNTQFIVNNSNTSNNYYVFRTRVAALGLTDTSIRANIEFGEIRLLTDRSGSLRLYNLHSAFSLGGNSATLNVIRGKNETRVIGVAGLTSSLTNGVYLDVSGLVVGEYRGDGRASYIRCYLVRDTVDITTAFIGEHMVIERAIVSANVNIANTAGFLLIKNCTVGTVFNTGLGTIVFDTCTTIEATRIGGAAATGANVFIYNCDFTAGTVSNPEGIIFFGNNSNNQFVRAYNSIFRVLTTSPTVYTVTTASTVGTQSNKRVLFKDCSILHASNVTKINQPTVGNNNIIELHSTSCSAELDWSWKILGDTPKFDEAEFAWFARLENIERESVINTTSGAPSAMFGIPVPQNCSVLAEADVVAINDNNTEQYAARLIRGFFRQTAGGAMGATVANVFQNFSPAISSDLIYDTTFNTVNVVVTGTAGKNITWKSRLKLKITRL